MQNNSIRLTHGRLVLLPLIVLPLVGCGLTVERSSRLAANGRDLVEERATSRLLRQRVSELEAALDAQRRATGDVAALEGQLAQARSALAAAERGRTTAARSARRLGTQLAEKEQQLAERQQAGAEAERGFATLRDAAAAEDRRLQGLRASIEQAQRSLAERQAASGEAERRLPWHATTWPPSGATWKHAAARWRRPRPASTV